MIIIEVEPDFTGEEIFYGFVLEITFKACVQVLAFAISVNPDSTSASFLYSFSLHTYWYDIHKPHSMSYH